MRMSWIVWLGFAVVFVAAVAVTRTGPKGGKPVANTRLMGTARVFLFLGFIACGVIGVFGVLRH